jgi:3-hydroxy acid dehydrogenase / malonic semialdehyde reductase
MNRLYGKTALVTGATAGIGAETARQLASMGVNLWLTGRRKDRLESLKKELSNTYAGIEIETFVFDVTSRHACQVFFDSLNGLTPDILINNAGLAAGADKVQDAYLDDWESMIDTNVRGLITLTRLFLPAMIARNSGHILNMSSIAGQEAYSGGAVYCATKHAVNAFTRSLKMDVGHTDIRVSLISPGAVETEFSTVRFKGDQARADKVYEGMKKLVAEDIAEVIVFVLNRPDHVNIMDTLILSVSQSSATQIFRK